MPTNTHPDVSFAEADSRADDMRQSIDEWLQDLIEATDEARASETFREWLDVQSRFHDYSYRNSLLILHQCPEATRVAGYRTWQTEFDRHVCEGESAIWIWAPIIAKRCPECENSSKYHEQNDCDYDETPPRDWSKGLVGFRPVPVFDVSRTEGEPLPELETATNGAVDELVSAVTEAAEALDVDVRIVSAENWEHGAARGVCTRRNIASERPLVEAKDRSNEADLARTLIHEYVHALLHFDVDVSVERAKREVEAEAVAYVVGRHFGLDVSGSAFYLAAWSEEAPADIEDRLDRISETAEAIIEAVA